MEPYLRKRLDENTANFKKSLDRIADKYLKLNDGDDALEVDINEIRLKTLAKYLKDSKQKLMNLGSKSQSDLKDQSLNSCISSNSQLKISCNEDALGNNSTFSGEPPKDNSAEEALRLLDESCRNLSESELLPEDQDEDLQMSLSSQSNSLAELYPTMVSRIGRAWHRQTVSEAASSVLRRYRRWRQRPKRNLNGTFDMKERPADDGTKISTGKMLVREISGSPSNGTEMKPHSVPSTVASLNPGQQPPGRERRLLIGETSHLSSVMNISDKTDPTQVSLNETFLVSEPSCPYKQSYFEEKISINATSPSQHPSSNTKSSTDPSFKRKRLSGSLQSVDVSNYAAETPSVFERPDIYSSPVRQSPFRARMTGTLSRSPLTFSRSPRDHDGCCSRGPKKPRSPSTSMPSPAKRSAVLLYPNDSSQSSKPLPLSPLSARGAENHRRFRRNLSFDSSLPHRVSQSPKQVDDEFIKLYHKFVCCSKSTAFNTLHCRLCGRSSEARRVLSSSSLAALALSPHRSTLRKRFREQSRDSHPQSKRLREETYTYSPGSKRHRNEMLRRCLSQSEVGLSLGAAPYSFSKQRTQQPAAYVEAWVIQHQPFFSRDTRDKPRITGTRL